MYDTRVTLINSVNSQINEINILNSGFVSAILLAGRKEVKFCKHENYYIEELLIIIIIRLKKNKKKVLFMLFKLYNIYIDYIY